MKRFAFVAPYQAEDVDGRPLRESLAPDTEPAPVVLVALDFLRDRVSQAKFIEGAGEAGDAADLQFETRRALRLQAAEAAARGYWELEGQQAKHLLNAVKLGPYHPRLGFNWTAHRRAVMAMVDAEAWDRQSEPAKAAE
jgi:hypothetical protein